MIVKRVDAEDCLPLRHQFIRPHLSLSDCVYEGDFLDLSFHLGAFEDGQLVSVASFYFERCPSFDAPFQYRLRGMATRTEFQGRGMSRSLLKMAFPIIKQNQCDLLWCYARLSAMGFYEKVGLAAFGHTFDLHGGPHHLMAIKLPSSSPF